jgi:hypothetical protein
MASTYSITFSVTNGNLGYPPGNPQMPVNHQIEDAYAPDGAQLGAAANNTRIQVKRNDGRISYYTIDSSRSDPSRNLIFLLPA